MSLEYHSLTPPHSLTHSLKHLQIRTSNGKALIRAHTKEQHLQWTNAAIFTARTHVFWSPVIVEGWLTKRARALPYSWNRRFFRLYMPSKRSDTRISKAEAIRQDLATLVVSGVTDVASKVASRMGSIIKNLLRLRK